MSLETTITALVDAANKLTTAVNDKIAAIDKALSDGLAFLKAEIRKGWTSSIVYVNSVTGVDATATGDISKPFKTIKAAVDSVVGNVDVMLAPGRYYYTGTIGVVGREVALKPYLGGTRDNITIFQNEREDGSVVNGAYFDLSRSALSARSLCLDLSKVPTNVNSFGRTFAWLRTGSSLTLGEYELAEGVTVKIGRQGATDTGNIGCVSYVSRSYGFVNMRNCSFTQVQAGAPAVGLNLVFTAEAGHATCIYGSTANALSGFTGFTGNLIGGVNYPYPV